MKFKFGLLPRVVLAIALGVACGFFLPGWATRIALTFNAIFGQFLGFAIPLLILGLVAPGIADLGRNAGRLLALTAALAYAFTLFSGFGTYLTGRLLFPALLEGSAAVLPEEGADLAPYFTAVIFIIEPERWIVAHSGTTNDASSGRTPSFTVWASVTGIVAADDCVPRAVM